MKIISLSRLIQSLAHAFHGVKIACMGEQNFRLQLLAGMVVLLCALWLQVSLSELIILLLLIGAVLSLELVNSIFERMIDVLKPRIHPLVRDLKDMMAAAVLTVSLIALIAGSMIFFPYVSALLDFSFSFPG